MLDHIVYGSFGNIISQTNSSNGDRFMFTGMEYDATTGIYYDQARYYDPTTGRFVSQDPKGFAAGDANFTVTLPTHRWSKLTRRGHSPGPGTPAGPPVQQEGPPLLGPLVRPSWRPRKSTWPTEDPTVTLGPGVEPIDEPEPGTESPPFNTRTD